MIIKIVKDEEEQQISLLIDGEGPNFTLRKEGHQIIAATREILNTNPLGWRTLVKNWAGLSIYEVRSSQKKGNRKDKETFQLRNGA